jgi:hypothetical protein
LIRNRGALRLLLRERGLRLCLTDTRNHVTPIYHRTWIDISHDYPFENIIGSSPKAFAIFVGSSPNLGGCLSPVSVRIKISSFSALSGVVCLSPTKVTPLFCYLCITLRDLWGACDSVSFGKVGHSRGLGLLLSLFVAHSKMVH